MTDPYTDELLRALDSLRGEYDRPGRYGDWAGSPWEWVVPLPPGVKGVIGERLFRHLAQMAGYDVERPTSTDHDWRVGGSGVEVKFATYASRSYSFLQIRPEQNYVAVVLFGVHPQGVRMWVESKEDVVLGSRGLHGGRDAGGNTNGLVLRPYRLPDWIKNPEGRIGDAMARLQTWCIRGRLPEKLF